MRTINFKGAQTGNKTDTGCFDPMSYDGKNLKCVCGYELLKESSNTYRCAGGGHQYQIQEGDITVDKFGNQKFSLKKPDGFE